MKLDYVHFKCNAKFCGTPTPDLNDVPKGYDTFVPEGQKLWMGIAHPHFLNFALA